MKLLCIRFLINEMCTILFIRTSTFYDELHLKFAYCISLNTNYNRSCGDLSLGYICPDHRTIFRSAIFSTILRHRRRSWATTFVLTVHTGIVRFFDIPFVDVLIQKRKAIVRQSYVSADST